MDIVPALFVQLICLVIAFICGASFSANVYQERIDKIQRRFDDYRKYVERIGME